MAKYDKRNKLFAEFDEYLKEIMEEENYSYSEDSFEQEIECEILDNVSDKEFEKEEDSSESCLSMECVPFAPGQIIDISAGKISKTSPTDNIVDAKDDFPAEKDEYEMAPPLESFRNLNIGNKEEYNNLRNIINPNKIKKRCNKRCQNID